MSIDRKTCTTSSAARRGLPAGGMDDHDRALFAFTVASGITDRVAILLLGLLGRMAGCRAGLSLSLIAAILGAVYIVYGALRMLLQGRIGADLALAQASLAALVLGQPFVAAEVVFIALLGEVLEAWTFRAARRAMGRLVDQTPRTARVRRDGPGGRDSRAARSPSAIG